MCTTLRDEQSGNGGEISFEVSMNYSRRESSRGKEVFERIFIDGEEEEENELCVDLTVDECRRITIGDGDRQSSSESLV